MYSLLHRTPLRVDYCYENMTCGKILWAKCGNFIFVHIQLIFWIVYKLCDSLLLLSICMFMFNET